jgi:neutral ceramidase
VSGPGLAVGAATQTIEIEPGLTGAGLRIWSDTFTSQESPLEVRALVATSGGEALVVIAADAIVIPDDFSARVRAAAAAAADVSPGQVLLNASHAHSVPPLPGVPISDAHDDLAAVDRFGQSFVTAAEGAVRAAAERLAPARLGAAWGSTPIGVYRRATDDQGRGHLGEVPDRPIDRSVGVVRFDDLEGRAIAVTFSYGCHPVLHGPRARAVSSDYPGPARAVVERNLAGAGTPPVAIFLQGCGGDINPRYGIGADEDPNETKDREGTVLGAEVLRVASEIRTDAYRGPRGRLHGLEISGWPWVPVEGHAAPRIASVSRTVTLPLSDLPSLDVAEGIRDRYEAALRQLESASAPPTDQRIARRWFQWSEVLLAATAAGRGTIDVPMFACRIGDVAFVGIAMEVFSDTGVAVRAESPFGHTEVLGYTNGSHGYLTRAQDFPTGGWSPLERYALPDMYPQAWLQPTAIGPAAEQIVVAACREMLAEIA